MPTVTPKLSDIALTTAGNTSLTEWVGTSEAIDDEIYKQLNGTGSGTYNYQTGKNTFSSAVYTAPSAINMTSSYSNPHLYWSMRCDVFPFCESLNTGSTNSGLMVRVQSSASNWKQWHIAGKDTWDGGWRNFVLDLQNSANLHSTSGTLNLAGVTGITFYTDNSNSGTIRVIDNTWIDVVRYGAGLQAESTTTESFDFGDIASDDASPTKYYGILQNVDGVFFTENLKAQYPSSVSNYVNRYDIPKNLLSAGDITGLSSAVWDKQTSEITANNSIGKYIKDLNFDSMDTDTALAVRAELATELARLDTTISSRFDGVGIILSDVRKVNGYNVTGSGQSGNEWGPA
jgi:hypothetical protein